MSIVPNCYHCRSDLTSKAGLTKNGKQRFYCRACRRFSRADSTYQTGAAAEAKATSLKKPTRNLPTANHLILKLRGLAQSLGRTPTTNDITEASKAKRGFPLHIYYEVFGNFPEAIRRAKLTARYDQQFDRERLFSELQSLRKSLKRALLARDVLAARKKNLVSSLYHFQRAFGSVPQAIQAAGAGRNLLTAAEIITYLRELQAEFGREPTGKNIARRFVPGETPSVKEIICLFGSLTAAKQAAGISRQIGRRR